MRDVADALRAVDIDPNDVETVVLTHLHWDHAANAARFPRATFVVQRAELDWLRDPLQPHGCIGRFYSDVALFGDMAASGRFRLLDGDETVAEGVEALLVRGHTPGSQIVVADVPGGRAVVSGDAIPLNENYLDDIPNGIHIDVRDAIRAIDRVRRLEPVASYAGHDPVACLDLGGTRTAVSSRTQ